MKLEILPIAPNEAILFHAFLNRQPTEYRKHFHPFQSESIDALDLLIAQNPKDRYRRISFNGVWVAFYMLRGWQQGYNRPSFGLLVDYQYANKGLGKLCLQAALTECRLIGTEEIMLKVALSNIYACKIYTNAGFKRFSTCKTTGHSIFIKDLA